MNTSTQYASAVKMVSLCKMIDNLLASCNQLITSKKIFFINHVPKTLSVHAALFSDLSEQITEAIKLNAGKNCIRISVDKTDQLIRLQIKPTPINGFHFSGTRLRH